MSTPIAALKDLIPGKIYNMYSKQWDVTNKARLISFDTTTMNRDISYWQFTDRGYRPVDETMLRRIFKEEPGAYGFTTIFAFWGWELNFGNTITEIN